MLSSSLSSCALLLFLAQGRVPLYPRAHDVPLSRGLEAEGEHVDAAYFTTLDDVVQVAGFYARRWENAGYPVSVEGHPPGAVVVAAFQTREARQLAVILRREGAVTLGFRVERALSVSSVDGGTAEQSSLQTATEGVLTASPGSLATVWKERVAHWQAEGFLLVSGEPTPGTTVLEKGGERVTLIVGDIRPGRVGILETRERIPRP